MVLKMDAPLHAELIPLHEIDGIEGNAKMIEFMKFGGLSKLFYMRWSLDTNSERCVMRRRVMLQHGRNTSRTVAEESYITTRREIQKGGNQWKKRVFSKLCHYYQLWLCKKYVELCWIILNYMLNYMLNYVKLSSPLSVLRTSDYIAILCKFKFRTFSRK